VGTPGEFLARMLDAVARVKGGDDQFLARMLDAVARVKGGDDQLRRTTRGLRTRAAKCTEVDGWIFELSLCTVTNL